MFFISLFLVFLPSCKKSEYCLACTQECYFCKVKNQKLCPASFATNIDFNLFIDSLVRLGDTCGIIDTIPIQSQSIGYLYCGNQSRALKYKNGFEAQNYKCKISYLTH